MQKDKLNNYTGLDYPATELSAFIFTIDVFIIGLRNGSVIQFSPEDIEGFKQWLLANSIRDISKDIDKPRSV